jgi:hypothetical protein
MLRGELAEDATRLKPMAAVCFSVNDDMIVWDPGEIKATWKNDQSH